MNAARLALPLLMVLAGGGGAVADAPLALPPIDRVEVRKAERTLTLWSRGRAVHTIAGIQLGDQPAGPKRFEGDERTPEGRYSIDWGNPDSAYHLSLHISYPDARDTAFAQRWGRSAGGMIMIHGQPGDLPGADLGARVPGDWTDGCIALANAEIELLWDNVPDGTAIDILP